ncbi:MAG: NrdH-redoxin [Ideonella sp. MAG2]|nr:MAG: NrdH-redoxin [Ideonella sp. MAG2]
MPVSGRGGRVDPASLPVTLRPVVSRYPVTLYTASGCGPCDQGRSLLLQRGIPFVEKSVNTDEDAQALAQLSGDRNLPVLSIGSQQLKGFQSKDWHGYLDAAGYPQSSTLGPGYRNPAPSPLAIPKPAPAPAQPRQPEAAAPRPAPSDPNAPKIRF